MAAISPPPLPSSFLNFSSCSCYTNLMQPESSKNYWKPDETEQDQVPQAPVVSVDGGEAIEPEQDAPLVESEPIRWQAHEYIDHERDVWWFIIFGIVVAAFMAAAIYLQAWTFVALIPIMAVALIVYVRRPPQLIDYTLSSQGLYVNDKLYPFGEYKAFGVVEDGNEHSIMLIPIERFKPGVTVYFPDDTGEAIVDLLGARLPMRELHLDVLDRILRKLRL